MSGSTAQDDETMMESNSSGPGTPLVSNPGTPLVSNPGTPLVSNPGTPRSIDTEVRNTPPPGALANNIVSAASAPQPPPPPVTTVHPAVMMMNIPRPQLPQSKYAQLLAVIEDMGKDIRPTYAGSRTSAERLKRGIVHARILVRECLMECERAART